MTILISIVLILVAGLHWTLNFSVYLKSEFLTYAFMFSFIAKGVSLLVICPFLVHGANQNGFHVSESIGPSFLSTETNASKKPTLLTQTQNLPQSIPHGILVPNNSYLELFSEDDLQMRIGQASVLEFPKANEFNLINGSLLLASKRETSMRISTKTGSVDLTFDGTLMMENAKKDNFKFILLEGFVQLSMNEKNRTLQAGNLILTRVQENTFSKILTIELPLLISSSKLINNFSKPVQTENKLISAAKVQSIRLKKRYQALIGDLNEQNELRMWALKKSTPPSKEK